MTADTDVVFTFTAENLVEIAEMERQGKFSGPYAEVLDRIRRRVGPDRCARVTMRNPDTAEEIEVCIPGLTPAMIILRRILSQRLCPCCGKPL